MVAQRQAEYRDMSKIHTLFTAQEHVTPSKSSLTVISNVNVNFDPLTNPPTEI